MTGATAGGDSGAGVDSEVAGGGADSTGDEETGGEAVITGAALVATGTDFVPIFSATQPAMVETRV